MRANVNSPAYVIGFTIAVSAAFTGAITTLQVAARPTVERNEALREEKALVSVFGLGDVRAMTEAQIADVVGRRIERGLVARDPQTGREFRLFRAYRSDGAPGATRDPADLSAIAFEFAGVGFWARITGLMALTPDLARCTGLVFLDQSETPGLGGRIAEAWFQEQFKGLDVTPPAPGAKFLYIGGGQPSGTRDPRHGRSVDAITGATQTSLAVEKFMNENLAEFRRAMAAGASAGGNP